MKCPICQKEVSLDGPEMPFCSERCRLIDLGNWSAEKYVISTPIESKIEKDSKMEEDEDE